MRTAPVSSPFRGPQSGIRSGLKLSNTGNASKAFDSSPGTSGPPFTPPTRSTPTPPKPTRLR